MIRVIFIGTTNSYLSFIKKGTISLMILKNDDAVFKHLVNGQNLDIYLDPETLSICTKTAFLKTASVTDMFLYNSYLNTLYQAFFRKIKFTGKGFRLTSFKKKRAFEFIFGYSHMYILYINKIFYKRYSKYKYIFFSKNSEQLKITSKEITNVKPLNVYTLRGLRETKATVVKRKGRKSPNL